MERILISACLVGQKVRYDGQDKPLASPLLQKWQDEGRLVPICPELLAGLGVPRAPAEIRVEGTGQIVRDQAGTDMTDAFMWGAQSALSVAARQNCRFAILTDGSPSCGSSFIYDGSFSGQRIPGKGITTALLEASGIQVFAQTALDQLAKALAETDAA
jgi:uncharacterized protein YbbK (DUF523 family)